MLLLFIFLFIIVILLYTPFIGGKQEKDILPLNESKYTKKDLWPYIEDLFKIEDSSPQGGEEYDTSGYWIILEKGQLAGFANVTFLSSISCLYILPEYRRYGLGKKLLFFLRDHLSKYKKVFVSLVKKNPQFDLLREKSIEYGFDHLQTENYAGLILYTVSSSSSSSSSFLPKAKKNEKNKKNKDKRKKDDLYFAPVGEELNIMQMREKIADIKKDVISGIDCKKKIIKLLQNFVDLPDEEFFKNNLLFSSAFSPSFSRSSSLCEEEKKEKSEKEEKEEKETYSVLDIHYNYGENFIYCLADPLCEAYCGSGSKNKKSLNKTFMYFFNREFGRDFHKFVISESGEGFYPSYYTGPKEFTIKI